MEQRSTERSDALSRFVERDSCSNLKDLRNIDSLLLMVPINYIAKVRSILSPRAHCLPFNRTLIIKPIAITFIFYSARQRSVFQRVYKT